MTNTLVRYYVLAGQSNVVGHASLNQLERLILNGAPSLQDFHDAHGWIERDDAFVTFKQEYGNLHNVLEGRLTAELYGGSAHTFGPEAGFGFELADHFDQDVVIVKAAGAAGLAQDWFPPSADSGLGGDFFNSMVVDIQDTMERVDQIVGLKGQTAELGGIVWWDDGYADASDPDFLSSYDRNLRNWISNVRQDLGNANLPIVIGSIGGQGDTADKEELQLRQIQEKVVSDTPNTILSNTQQFVTASVRRNPECNDYSRYWCDAQVMVHIGRQFAADMLHLEAQETIQVARELKLTPAPTTSESPSAGPTVSLAPSVGPSVFPSLAPSLSHNPSVHPSSAGGSPGPPPTAVGASASPSEGPTVSLAPSVAPSVFPSLAPSLSHKPSVAGGSLGPSAIAVGASGSPSQGPTVSLAPSVGPSVLAPSLSHHPTAHGGTASHSPTTANAGPTKSPTTGNAGPTNSPTSTPQQVSLSPSGVVSVAPFPTSAPAIIFPNKFKGGKKQASIKKMPPKMKNKASKKGSKGGSGKKGSKGGSVVFQPPGTLQSFKKRPQKQQSKKEKLPSKKRQRDLVSIAVDILP